MKKLLLSLILCFGAVQISSAQTNADLVAKFLNGVVKKDVVTLIDVMHPECHKDIDKLVAQCDLLKFRSWNYLHAVNITNNGCSATQYLVAVQIGLDPYNISESVMSHENKSLYLSPSGHVFLYEVLGVVTENGRKYVVCNADFLSIPRVEKWLRENGRQLPAKYYNGNY